jgi:hypothetical protein
MDLPRVEDADRITGISDPVIRNLNITQCYYELSHAFDLVTGTAPNWCSFATWASKQAGQTIRKEDLLRTFEFHFRHSNEVATLLEDIAGYLKEENKLTPLHSYGDTVLKILQPDLIFERSGDAVARGNKKVFEEIGRGFARFLATFSSETDFTDTNIKAFCETLRPGDPPDGQQYLRDAFTTYCKARVADDPKSKAEYILYANLLIGFHEQTRLQPEIVEALNAPVGNTDAFRQRLLQELLPGFWFRIRHYIAGLLGRKLPLDIIIDRLTDVITRLIREVVTYSLMTLHIPENEVLRLGKDLIVDFPSPLRQLSNPALKDLLIRIDPTPDSVSRSGVKDWGNFDDRIHFIADFFRSYYEHSPLLDAPFNPEQTKTLKAGQLPGGRL